MNFILSPKIGYNLRFLQVVLFYYLHVFLIKIYFGRAQVHYNQKEYGKKLPIFLLHGDNFQHFDVLLSRFHCVYKSPVAFKVCLSGHLGSYTCYQFYSKKFIGINEIFESLYAKLSKVVSDLYWSPFKRIDLVVNSFVQQEF